MQVMKINLFKKNGTIFCGPSPIKHKNYVPISSYADIKLGCQPIRDEFKRQTEETKKMG